MKCHCSFHTDKANASIEQSKCISSLNWTDYKLSNIKGWPGKSNHLVILSHKYSWCQPGKQSILSLPHEYLWANARRDWSRAHHVPCNCFPDTVPMLASGPFRLLEVSISGDTIQLPEKWKSDVLTSVLSCKFLHVCDKGNSNYSSRVSVDDCSLRSYCCPHPCPRVTVSDRRNSRLLKHGCFVCSFHKCMCSIVYILHLVYYFQYKIINWHCWWKLQTKSHYISHILILCCSLYYTELW